MSQPARMFMSDEVMDIVYYDLQKKGYTHSQVSDMLERKPHKIEKELEYIGLVLCDMCELEFIADGYLHENESKRYCEQCVNETWTEAEREEMLENDEMFWTEFYGYL